MLLINLVASLKLLSHWWRESATIQASPMWTTPEHEVGGVGNLSPSLTAGCQVPRRWWSFPRGCWGCPAVPHSSRLCWWCWWRWSRRSAVSPTATRGQSALQSGCMNLCGSCCRGFHQWRCRRRQSRGISGLAGWPSLAVPGSLWMKRPIEQRHRTFRKEDVDVIPLKGKKLRAF